MSTMHRFSTSQSLSNVCTAIISCSCSMLRLDTTSPFEPTLCLAVLETRMSKTEDTKLKAETYQGSRVENRNKHQTRASLSAVARFLSSIKPQLTTEAKKPYPCLMPKNPDSAGPGIVLNCLCIRCLSVGPCYRHSGTMRHLENEKRVSISRGKKTTSISLTFSVLHNEEPISR